MALRNTGGPTAHSAGPLAVCVVVACPFPLPLPLPLPFPFPLPFPLPSSTVVVGGGWVGVVAGGAGAAQSATGIAQEAFVVTVPSGQAAVAYTVTVA